jgi:hypothetical protein
MPEKTIHTSKTLRVANNKVVAIDAGLLQNLVSRKPTEWLMTSSAQSQVMELKTIPIDSAVVIAGTLDLTESTSPGTKWDAGVGGKARRRELGRQWRLRRTRQRREILPSRPKSIHHALAVVLGLIRAGARGRLTPQARRQAISHRGHKTVSRRSRRCPNRRTRRTIRATPVI